MSMESKKDVLVLFDVQNTLYSPRKGLFDDVKEVIECLKSSGIYLGIISNMHEEELVSLLEEFGIKQYFDVIISSYAYDTLKPDPKLVKVALTLLKDSVGASPSQIFYVGDRPDVDVRMANIAGIISVRIIRGKYALKSPEDNYEVADYEIKSLYELYNILGICNKTHKSESKDYEVL